MFKKLPKYRKERIIKPIQACAWFIKRKYGETNVIAKIIIVWLLFEERVGFAIMKFAFKGLNIKNISENLELKVAEENWTLQ